MREWLKCVQSRIINLSWASKYVDLSRRGQVCLIKIATPAFPEGLEAIKAVGKHLLADLKEMGLLDHDHV